MNLNNPILNLAKTAFYLTGAACFAATFGAILFLTQYSRTVLAPAISARDAQIQQLLATVNNTTAINAINTERAVANLTQITVDAGETIDRLNAALFDKSGLVPESITLVSQLSKVADDSDKAAQALNSQLTETGDVARTQLEQVGGLLATAQHAVEQTGDGAATAFASVNKTVQDAGVVIADPNIPKTIENVQESTKSIDGSLRSLRSTAGTVKKIFMALIQPLADVALKIF